MTNKYNKLRLVGDHLHQSKQLVPVQRYAMAAADPSHLIQQL